MNIFITGGTGYIGGRLADYLKRESANTHIFLSTIDKKLPSWTNDFTVVSMNLLDETSINSSLKNKQIDLIIHLAALNEIDSMKDPLAALEVNTKGTYKLLEAANRYGIKKFIYFSTFHVYGHEGGEAVITENTPTKPFHPYAITHKSAEDLVSFFRHYHGMQTLVLRLSNGYGYPMDKTVDRWSLVFNDLCKQAVTTQRLVLKSSGKQHRDFISLKDVARAVYHFIFNIPDSWDDGLFNLGGECSMSILEAAKIVARLYKDTYKHEIKEIRMGENKGKIAIQKVRYSVQKLKKTGFALTGDMEGEVKKTFAICETFKDGN